MIKLPKNFLSNLTPSQYREQLKLLPKMTDEKTQLYTMLGFTLAAMSFFGIFAINPTLSTIAELERQFDDLKFVQQQLITKTQNLSILTEKYQSLENDVPVVLDAMPQKAEAAKFLGQVNALLARSQLQVRSLRTFGVELTPDKKPGDGKAFSFLFSLEAEGSYEDMLSFIQSITRINRLVVVSSVDIDKDEKDGGLILNLQGRQYFRP
jgi:Tfp pilus assembly protein PilO